MEFITYDTPAWVQDIMKYVYQGSPMRGQQFFRSQSHSPMKGQEHYMSSTVSPMKGQEGYRSKTVSPMRAQQFGLLSNSALGGLPRPIIAGRLFR